MERDRTSTQARGLPLDIMTDRVRGMRNIIKPRKSRAVTELRYDKRERTLTVEFINGGRYLYARVTPSVWRLVKREGKANGYGRAVNAIVKPNHDHVRVA